MNRHEQFRIYSLEELKEAYKHFEDEWNENYSLESEIRDFIGSRYGFITYNPCGITLLFGKRSGFKQIPNPLKQKQMKPFTISGSPALKKAFCEEAGLGIESYNGSLDYIGYYNKQHNNNVYFSPSMSKGSNHFHLPDNYQEALEFVKGFKEPEFEEGKWYKSEHGFSLCCYQGDNEADSTSFEGYGFYDVHGWVSKNTDPEAYESWSKSAGWELATDKEVEQALIKEAKKRGFKKGVRVKNLLGSNGGSILGDKKTANTDDIELVGRYLFMGHLLIMRKGEWAEIEKETYSIGDVFKDTTNDDTYILSEVDEDKVQLTCLEDGEAYLYGAEVSNRWKITTDEMEEITGGDFDDFEKVKHKIKY